ncbi:MAG: DUF1636 domain-containing protein [Pseudomonadota bacterium]
MDAVVSDKSGRSPLPTPTLSVCLTCRGPGDTAETVVRGGARFAEAILAARRARGADLPAHTVRGVRCMSQCLRPCTIALTCEGRFSYVFGDLDPGRDADDVLTLLATYAQEPEGFLPRDRRPEPLQAGILGRIPPLVTDSDLVTTLADDVHREREPQ